MEEHISGIYDSVRKLMQIGGEIGEVYLENVSRGWMYKLHDRHYNKVSEGFLEYVKENFPVEYIKIVIGDNSYYINYKKSKYSEFCYVAICSDDRIVYPKLSLLEKLKFPNSLNKEVAMFVSSLYEKINKLEEEKLYSKNLDLYIKNLEQERRENIKKDKYYRLALVLEKIQNDIKDVMSKTFYESGATSLRKEHIINDHTKEVIDSINDKLKLNNPNLTFEMSVTYDRDTERYRPAYLVKKNNELIFGTEYFHLLYRDNDDMPTRIERKDNTIIVPYNLVENHIAMASYAHCINAGTFKEEDWITDFIGAVDSSLLTEEEKQKTLSLRK